MSTTQNIPQGSQIDNVKKPLISFIITAYNIPARMLRQCVDSILALSLNRKQREIIIIDDGSDEPAIKHLKDIQDELTYLRQNNKGLSEARNIGLRCANGQYIQFIDGDDYLLQPQYEHCIDILRFHKPIDVVMFCMTNNTKVPMVTDFTGPITGTEYMLSNNLRGSACRYIFSRSLLGDLRFTVGIYHEDEEFTPQLLLKAKILYSTPAKAYYYRYRSESIMHLSKKPHKDKRLQDMLTVILRLQTLQKTIKEESKQQALNRRINQLTMDYLYNVIKLTKSWNKLKKAKTILSEHNLYPLPDRKYTIKYSLFRKLI